MTFMDSSYMEPAVTGPSANPLDSFMDALRAQIAGEVKSDIAGDIMERVLRIVGSAMQNLMVNQQITVHPIVERVSVTQPAPIVDVELNQEDVVAELRATRECMERCMKMLASPVQRTVNRGPDGLIISVTERHM